MVSGCIQFENAWLTLLKVLDYKIIRNDDDEYSQQDGATAHLTREIFQYLGEFFDYRIINRFKLYTTFLIAIHQFDFFNDNL